MFLIAFILLAPHCSRPAEAKMHYEKFKSSAPISAKYTSSSAFLPATTHLSAAAAAAYAQQQAAWPPTRMRDNWIILQATSNTAVAAATTAEGEVAGEQPQSNPLNSYDTQPKQQTVLPIDYYSYNRSSSGNYHSSTQDVHIVEPYVLTISNQHNSQLMPPSDSERSQVFGNSDSHVGSPDSGVNNHNNRRYVNTKNSAAQQNYNHKSQSKHNNNKYGSNIRNDANNENTAALQPQRPALFDRQEDIAYNSHSLYNVNVISNSATLGDDSMEVDGFENVLSGMEDAQFDEVLAPLGKLLDKVKQFCEIWKQIISVEDTDLASSELASATDDGTFEHAASATTTTHTATAVTNTIHLLAEVQGRRSAPTGAAPANSAAIQQSMSPTTDDEAPLLWSKATVQPSSTAAAKTTTTTANKLVATNDTTKATAKSLTSAALAIGRGKKLKKKLKNLMLPLLLAYKLKFIALVPLLISGLTLLVGSTGLAGFFFALFITVISLKSGGKISKSIVIKKDW